MDELLVMIRDYFDDVVTVDDIRDYVHVNIGDRIDSFFNQVAMSIYHYEDQLIPEDEFKNRLNEIYNSAVSEVNMLRIR